MTREREKAINILENLKGMIEDNQGNDYDAAFDMAIKALKEQETCEDAISRELIQEYLVEYYLSQYLFTDVREVVENINAYIGEMPSVNSNEGCVSRQVIQDYITEYLYQYLYNGVREANDVKRTIKSIDAFIRKMPSIQPKAESEG